MGGPWDVSARRRPLLAFQDTALKMAVAMPASANGTSSAGIATVPAGRPGAAGRVVREMPSESAALRASCRSQVGPPRRLATPSWSPPAGASRSIMPIVARRSTSLMLRR
jgi:hypothetical protein